MMAIGATELVKELFSRGGERAFRRALRQPGLIILAAHRINPADHSRVFRAAIFGAE